jgi:hypothetical protein
MTKARTDFEKVCLSRLRDLLKGTGWRKRDNLVFAEVDGYYVQADVLVHKKEPKTRFECSFKPMAVDPILWEISGTPECLDEPLSFRSYCIGGCTSYPLLFADIEQAGDDAEKVAAQILPCCSRALALLRENFGNHPFSELLAELQEQGARGNVATSRIAALIAEGRTADARTAAEASLATYGPLSPAVRRVGKLFEHQIIRWLDARAGQQGRITSSEIVI